MTQNLTKEDLINFEKEIVEMFNNGELKSPIHLSGGNENEVIAIFERIKPNDWVFSTYRGHYHALLHGIEPDWLKGWIRANKSIHVMNNQHKFITSAIVGGTLPTALGVAMGLKMSNSPDKVWAFIGDMTGHTGVFWECINYAYYHKLPITFVIEDNGLSTDTPTSETWNVPNKDYFDLLCTLFEGMIIYYKYTRTYGHYGTGKFIAKLWEGVDETKQKGF